MGGRMCWQVFMYQGASGCTCLAIKMSLCACVWGICTRACVRMRACVRGARGRTRMPLRSAFACVGWGEGEGREWEQEGAHTPLSLAQSQNHSSLTM